jgi:hypothetical protein
MSPTSKRLARPFIGGWEALGFWPALSLNGENDQA